MTFPIEKILNMDIRDYCECVGKKLSDYTLIGVHCGYADPLVEHFASEVPSEAEVVVNYQPILNSGSKLATGIALILKKETMNNIKKV